MIKIQSSSKFLIFLTLLFSCVIAFGLAAGESKASSQDPNGHHSLRILVGCPIRQKPQILHEFLSSLDRLEKNSYSCDYFFVDDNVIDESHALLAKFQREHPSCWIEGPRAEATTSSYVCNEITHQWNEDTIWKVAAFKERMIRKAKLQDYDYLFLIDSDIVLHPQTIEQLILANKDIVSNVFWTKWYPHLAAEPQVWLHDVSTQWHIGDGEDVPYHEAIRRRDQFFSQLRIPGVYEVGGLGACTLISRHALQKGVSFKRLSNLTFWGEDRHFCVRAVALGLGLYVDTHLPACHIYRESAMCGVAHYKWACEQKVELPLTPTPRITLSMVVRNEEKKYLRRVLESARNYITDAVIIDDASTDKTVEVCRESLKGIPLRLIQNSESQFANEIVLRKQQWEETIQTKPDWIIFLDADEIFEHSFESGVKDLVLDNDVDVYFFRLYDMWDEGHFRDDQYWSAHKFYRPFLVRYKPELTYRWKETAQHCGRMPLSINEYKNQKLSEFRLKHYGWANPEDRRTKLLRYQQLDPESRYGCKAQYDSILDPNPNLVVWKE